MKKEHADDASLGGRVKTLRVKRGLSQQDAASRSLTTPQQWSDVERGRRFNPTLSQLRAVATALGVDPGKLIADPSVVELAKTLDRLDRDGYELAGKARQLMLGRELMSPRGAVTPVWVRKKLEITKAQADDLLETLVASGALVTDGKDYMRP